jgi:hypothetical protein
MDEEIAWADQFDVIFQIFFNHPAGAVFQAVIGLGIKHSFEKWGNLFLIRVDLEFAFLRELLYSRQKIIFMHGSRGEAHYFLSLMGGDFDIGIFLQAGGADLRRFNAIMNVIAYMTSPIFFHFLFSLSSWHASCS